MPALLFFGLVFSGLVVFGQIAWRFACLDFKAAGGFLRKCLAFCATLQLPFD